MSESSRLSGFPTTHWSRVASAGDPTALAELCGAYWYPIYALIRREGHQPDQALDLTQGYFARLIEKGTISAANPSLGRFRSFLRADCRYFLSDCRDHAHAQKRGGGRALLSIDTQDAEGRYIVEPADDLTPDLVFDRAWGLTLLARALDRLAAEYESRGQGRVFENLHEGLTGGARTSPHAEIARELGMTEAAVQQASSRLRKRYKEALRDEIAATLADPTAEAVESEIRDLFDALGR